MAGACILGIIIRKLSHREEPGPIVLLEVDESLEIHFYRNILLFRLAVCLQVKSGGEPLLDAKEVAEQRPEFQGEKQPSIENDWIRQAVLPNYHVEDDFR